MKSVLQNMLNGPFDPNRPPPCCPREDAIYWHSAAMRVPDRNGLKVEPESMATFCSDCTMQYRAEMTEQNKCIKSLLEDEK